MDPAVFIEFLRHQRLVKDYFYMSAVAILFYDYLLTFHLEIKFIWRSRWTYTKVLCLLIRYMTFANTFIVLRNQLFPNMAVNKCRTDFPVAAWLLVVKLSLAEIVLAIRTWAVWYRNRVVGAILTIMLLANFVVQCVSLSRFLTSLEYAPAPYPGFQGCFLIKADRILWVNYASFIVVAVTVFLFLISSAWRAYRYGSNNELLSIIHRDGILSYVFLLTITGANLVVMLSLPIDYLTLLSPMEDILYMVLTARIIFNIRDAGTRPAHELHATYNDQLRFAYPLQRVSDEQGYSTPSRMFGDHDSGDVTMSPIHSGENFAKAI